MSRLKGMEEYVDYESRALESAKQGGRPDHGTIFALLAVANRLDSLINLLEDGTLYVNTPK